MYKAASIITPSANFVNMSEMNYGFQLPSRATVAGVRCELSEEGTCRDQCIRSVFGDSMSHS